MSYSASCPQGLLCIWKRESVSCSVVSDSLRPHGLWPTRLLWPWTSPGKTSPGKNTGVGCHSLLQGIFLTQGSNPGLLHCLHSLSHQGSPALHIVVIYCSLSWPVRFWYKRKVRILSLWKYHMGLPSTWTQMYMTDSHDWFLWLLGYLN